MGWREKNRPEGVRYWCGGHLGWDRIFRHPRTTQERRLWDDDYGRAARRKLPDVRWDIFRRDREDRSWKRHRRRQWKEKRP